MADSTIDTPNAAAGPLPKGSALHAFWRTLTKVDRTKVNYWIAFRNAMGVALPLAVGIALHNPLGAVAVTVGALNVSYSDGTDPYLHRAGRMLLWTLLGAFAVFLGSVTGTVSVLAVLAAAIWAFIAGLCVAISLKAGDLGLNTLVALIVFGARGASDLEGAAKTGLLVLAGGLLQTIFALLLWPLGPNTPERRVLGRVYSDLSAQLNPSAHDLLDAQLRNPTQQVQDTLDALGRDHSVEGERFRLLFDQADRIRLSTFVLHRLSGELRSRVQNDAELEVASGAIDNLLHAAADVLAELGRCLSAGDLSPALDPLLAGMQTYLDAGLKHCAGSAPLLKETASAMDTFAGQVRVVVSLGSRSTPAGLEQYDREQNSFPWRLRVGNWLGKLRANLDPKSVYFRHAVRLAACVAIADCIGRTISWQRSYWLPMTVAVILKPDFTTTFSRGVLRLAGTFGGLFIATILYHLLPVSVPSELALSQLLLVGVFTFSLRSIGAANYGVFSLSVSALIVFLVAATGIPPKDVILQRALNTSAGGLFALLAYAVWPTWERLHVASVFADMLDAARRYLQEIIARFRGNIRTEESALDDMRLAWRMARSNAETTADRLSTEPRVKPEQISCLTSILASSHGFVHAVTGLEAALIQHPSRTPPAAFLNFARDVDFTLYFLASALRGSKAASGTLPQLREDHRRIVESRDQFAPMDDFIVMETDRLTVSLNTLREQVLRYLQTV